MTRKSQKKKKRDVFGDPQGLVGAEAMQCDPSTPRDNWERRTVEGSDPRRLLRNSLAIQRSHGGVGRIRVAVVVVVSLPSWNSLLELGRNGSVRASVVASSPHSRLACGSIGGNPIFFF
uniref:Uncharacterized protein n=1 Tax=Chloropicon primus TaxID=1764295 RepID=A0A7S2T315_9CHLO|mmetsp:Transcript_3755/g.10754  ORF Transcript_3755/g.10754 Transcript_3755/m.10754 type:complete len:119 (+) Transcript_3755:214-570(+)